MTTTKKTIFEYRCDLCDAVQEGSGDGLKNGWICLFEPDSNSKHLCGGCVARVLVEVGKTDTGSTLPKTDTRVEYNENGLGTYCSECRKPVVARNSRGVSRCKGGHIFMTTAERNLAQEVKKP